MGRNQQTLVAGFSSRTDEWETPAVVFNALNDEFQFTLDPCATPLNKKCGLYFTKDLDGLKQVWAPHRVFMNPPYGIGIRDWMKKAYEESKAGALVVALVPARTDTRWFHEWCYGKAALRFVKGRITFLNPDVPKDRPLFPSLIAIYGEPPLI